MYLHNFLFVELSKVFEFGMARNFFQNKHAKRQNYPPGRDTHYQPVDPFRQTDGETKTRREDVK